MPTSQFIRPIEIEPSDELDKWKKTIEDTLKQAESYEQSAFRFHGFANEHDLVQHQQNFEEFKKFFDKIGYTLDESAFYDEAKKGFNLKYNFRKKNDVNQFKRFTGTLFDGLSKLLPIDNIVQTTKQFGKWAGLAAVIVTIAGFVKGMFNHSKILSTYSSAFSKIFGHFADLILIAFLPLINRVLRWLIVTVRPFVDDFAKKIGELFKIFESEFWENISTSIADFFSNVFDNFIGSFISGILSIDLTDINLFGGDDEKIENTEEDFSIIYNDNSVEDYPVVDNTIIVDNYIPVSDTSTVASNSLLNTDNILALNNRSIENTLVELFNNRNSLINGRFINNDINSVPVLVGGGGEEEINVSVAFNIDNNQIADNYYKKHKQDMNLSNYANVEPVTA